MERDCIHSNVSSSEDSLHTSTLLLSTCSSSSARHRRRRTEPRTLLRRAKLLLFIVIVVFLLLGILLTTFGFADLLSIPEGPFLLALRIAGPVCLSVDLVTCLVCTIVFQLWREEWKRRRQAVELRNRVLLHALAIDVMNKSSTNELLRDPRIQRKVLQQLRHETAAEISSTRSNSIKSSQNVNSSRRQSGCSISIDAPPGLPLPPPSAEAAAVTDEDGRRRSSRRRRRLESGLCGGGGGVGGWVDGSSSSCSILRLPGIQISRMETLDLSSDDLPLGGSVSRSVLIESRFSGDVYRISCTSEYSLNGCSGGGGGGNRSSRASSFSSRIWDLSSRESEWDADVSIGSRESQVSVARQDWSGGPASDLQPRRTLLLPPPTTTTFSSRRTPTVVSFCPSASGRRHSSPTECLNKCRDCISGRGVAETPPAQPSNAAADKPNLLSVLKRKYPAPAPLPELARKYSSEDNQLSSTQTNPSGTVDLELEQPADDGPPGVHPTPVRVCGRDGGHRRNANSKGRGRGLVVRRRSPGGWLVADQCPHHTDDSEIERRVNRVFYEIEHSLTDSVDESKIQSQEFEPMSPPARVDMQTQTIM